MCSNLPNFVQPSPNDNNVAIIDSGASGHYLTVRANIAHKWKAKNPISVRLPNGVRITNTYEAHLSLPNLPASACLARIFKELSSVSLISIGQLCNVGCKATFEKNQVTIIHNDKIILKGYRNFINQLLEVNLNDINPSIQASYPSIDSENVMQNVFQVLSKASIVSYLHAASGYPVKSTWLQAITKGFFHS